MCSQLPLRSTLRASVRSRTWGEQRRGHKRTCCPATVGTAGPSLASTIAKAVELRFNVPYRTQYGQSLSIVGSTADFGAWDPDIRVPMEWSDGDIWQAQVTADKGEVEYKYVIVDQNGEITQWKPGGNFEIKLENFSGTVQIEDTWDGSLHEVKTSGTWAAAPAAPTTPAAAPAGPAAASPPPPPAATAAPAPEAPPRPETPPAEAPAPSAAVVPAARSSTRALAAAGEYDDVLREALEHTFSELQDTLDESYDLLEAAAPDDPRLLMNDQKLAAVHQRATSLSKAIDAGAPPPAYILKEIGKEDERASSASARRRSKADEREA